MPRNIVITCLCLLAGCGSGTTESKPESGAEPNSSSEQASHAQLKSRFQKASESVHVAQEISQIVEAGPGIYKQTFDPDGKIVSIIACGTALYWPEVFNDPIRAVAAAEQAATWDAMEVLAGYTAGTELTELTTEEGHSEILIETTSETTISSFETVAVDVDTNNGIVTVLLGWSNEASNYSLHPVLVKTLYTSESTNDEIRATSRQIWINKVLVIDEEFMIEENGSGRMHYKQWYSHGWKWINVTAELSDSDSRGLRKIEGRNWRESGLPEDLKQFIDD